MVSCSGGVVGLSGGEQDVVVAGGDALNGMSVGAHMPVMVQLDIWTHILV